MPKMPQSHLLRMAGTLEAIRAELSVMRPIAEQAASKLVDGGTLWSCGLRPLVGEFMGRAGGPMMMRMVQSGLDHSPGPEDVIMGFPEEGQPIEGPPIPEETLNITFGDKPCPTANLHMRTHAGEFDVSPTLAMAACGWVFTGELIAALTRLGKMPTIYESVGAYFGYSRILKFKHGEIAFHESHEVPAIEPGILGGCYIEAVSAMLKRIEKEQRKNLDRAKAWAHEAREAGKRVMMYSAGHIFPEEISNTAIGKLFESGTWETGFRHPKPGHDYSAGDFIAHIGYQHPPDGLLRKARKAGARVVYVCLRSERDFIHDRNVIWIDPMWKWPDACVPLEGYDIPLLPASGVVNGSVAWEMSG